MAEDKWYANLATSPDGVLWGFPPDNEVISPSQGRSWDSGAIRVGCGMVELPDNRVGVPFVGHRDPHKYPKIVEHNLLAWALWEKDRLVGLQADEIGYFTTHVVRFQGNCLRLNVRTRHVGDIRVEVLDSQGQPLKTFDDCDHISGDFSGRLVTWNGNPDIGRGDGEPVSFRVKLSYGELFSMRFE